MFATATKRKVMMIAALCGCGMLLGGAGEAMGQTPATSTGLDTPGPGGGNTPSAQADILEIGPIKGLTTGWHPAPDLTSIPVGTQVRFQQFAGADATVVWTGATEISRDSTRSTAECDLKSAGTYIIQAAVVNPNGSIATSVCQLVAVDIAIEDIVVSNPVVSVQPLQVNENSPNYVTMEYFFGESIAALHERAPGHYLTSVDRELTFSIDVDPPGFAPLLEWRVNGQPAALGTPYGLSLYETGVHSISAGPPQFSQEVEVETYSVTITSRVEGEDIIPEGEPVTFEAVTDPPGYENHVTWLSSTKYGTAAPVLGQGPTLTVQFDDTWGPDDGWQWLGVKGDDFPLAQDQKCETSTKYPPAGVDNMLLSGEFFVEIGDFQETIVVLGRIEKVREDPQLDPITCAWFINTSCNSITLTDIDGLVSVEANPEMPVLGQIQQVTPGVDFPATSFFDVFFILTITVGRSQMELHNEQPVHISATIDELIPVGTAFLSTDTVTLFDERGKPQGQLHDVARTVEARLP